VLPRAGAAYGIEEKLRGYSLNTDHPVGSHKARVFRSALGITLDDIDHLVEQMLDGVLVAPITAVRDNPPHGLLCEVLISVQGINDAALDFAITTTVWEYRSSEDAPRLVSAYIDL
jgi:Domain of unknown function (DUF6883)